MWRNHRKIISMQTIPSRQSFSQHYFSLHELSPHSSRFHKTYRSTRIVATHYFYIEFPILFTFPTTDQRGHIPNQRTIGI
jgi:hypothetical protein